uniref:Fe2OG dioxygenase domain-containing protein n=2 Tax=Bursaphelenchus xylophilus TaxID=6326 RepID=A0A1I7SAP1_BURXY
MQSFLWVLCFLFAARSHKWERIKELLENDDIKNTWTKSDLMLCTNPRIPFTDSELFCQAVLTTMLDIIHIEYLSIQPTLFKIHKFGTPSMISSIKKRFFTSDEVTEQRVEGATYSAGHRGRVADGLWLEPHEPCVIPLFRKLQRSLRVNPAIAENFLVLKYDKNGHYAPHYDHLFPMTKEYDDGWFEFFGNRMATALLIVQQAELGGGTIFPHLDLVVESDPGDLLLWFNADSNDVREQNSLHASCPVERGQKMAVSLWIRGNFQDQLFCPVQSSRYSAVDMVKRIGDIKHFPQFGSRPQIPREYGGYWDDDVED